jgi:hypothetical protein
LAIEVQSLGVRRRFSSKTHHVILRDADIKKVFKELVESMVRVADDKNGDI